MDRSERSPSGVRSVWCSLLAQFPQVTASYWLGREEAGRLTHRHLVIVTQAGDGDDSAKAPDSLSTALRGSWADAHRSQALVDGELPTAELRRQGIEPFYVLDGPTT